MGSFGYFAFLKQNRLFSIPISLCYDQFAYFNKWVCLEILHFFMAKRRFSVFIRLCDDQLAYLNKWVRLVILHFWLRFQGRFCCEATGGGEVLLELCRDFFQSRRLASNCFSVVSISLLLDKTGYKFKLTDWSS